MASASLRKSLLEVKLHDPCMVQPSSAHAQPLQVFFLSNIDQAMAPLTVRAVFAFAGQCAIKPTENPALVMKEALKKVLVHYYPIAGRLRASGPQGRLVLECNGEGVLFVEADANIELSQLGDLALPQPSTHGRLISPFPAVQHPPLLTAQVTKFQCGGFVLGLVFNHCLLDGVALAQFLNSWAETVQGLPLSMPPILDRTFLKARSPLQIKYPHSEYLHIPNFGAGTQSYYDNIVYKSFSFSPSDLKNLKKAALEDGMVSRCSIIEALTALMWTVRTKAIGVPPEQQVKLIIAINAGMKGRSRSSTSWEPVIPKGYIGNGFMLTYAVTTAGELEKKPFSHAVTQVQEAMARGTEEYMRSQIDYMEQEKTGMPPLSSTFVILSWCGLRFYEMEFGCWGKPKHAGPVTLLTKETAILHPSGENQKDINVVLGLPPHAAHKIDEFVHPHLHFLTSRI